MPLPFLLFAGIVFIKAALSDGDTDQLKRFSNGLHVVVPERERRTRIDGDVPTAETHCNLVGSAFRIVAANDVMR